MNVKFAVLIILIIALATGCQNTTPETFTPTPNPITPTFTHIPILTLTTVPTSTSEPLVHQPELISKEKLSCSSLGTFTKCVDEVLNIEFQYPTIWGEIEAELRTGGYTGYAYFYYFDGKMPGETEPLVAGGRSRDYSEGRGWMPTDFAGYGDVGIQSKESCEPRDLYPLCEEVRPDVAWMIRFPNAKFLCDGFLSTMLYPTLRIEINSPTNPTINGFVFEAPLFSEQFYSEVESDLYPLLGLGAEMRPTKCDDESQQAFDAKLKVFLDKLTNKSADSETLKNLDELTHLANSIVFR
jgi:hypothetical protein